MGRVLPRNYWCSVVSESVVIRLKHVPGWSRQPGYFVQCNQADCQYVDANEPPCPLNVGLFGKEIKTAEAGRNGRDGD